MDRFLNIAILAIFLIVGYMTDETRGLVIGFAALGALGGIFTLVNRLSPITRFIREHHGVSPEGKLTYDSDIYVSNYPISPSKEVTLIKLGALVRTPKKLLPICWVIPVDQSNPLGTHYYVKTRYWRYREPSELVSAFLSLRKERGLGGDWLVQIQDHCGNSVGLGKDGMSAKDIAIEIITFDQKYRNVQDMELKLFLEFARKKLDEALKSTRSIAVNQVRGVVDHLIPCSRVIRESNDPTHWESLGALDLEAYAERVFPSNPPPRS